MQLEYSILEHLSDNDNGKFVDITFIEEDHEVLWNTLDELLGRNMILVDNYGARDFGAFGIANNRKRSIKAKIKMNGRIRFHTLKSKKSFESRNDRRKNRWSLSYFF